MPTYIVKLIKEKKAFYLLWSTVVDAPITYGLSLGELESYYRYQYGEHGMAALSERMRRVEEKGTSAHDDVSAEETISCNRLGKRGKTLSMDEIIQKYCEGRPDGEIEA